ncbi:hypothetical protein JTB14_024971 [Gonioctena quinquepunctata]|nr:hypothetical protein JTB14_024971 [Gonioctena quinquepunctata]
MNGVPSGHVTITNAKNESASSVYFSWLAPPPDTIFGEFLGYRISYKPRTKPEDNKEIYLRDPTVTNHLLTQLEPWTQYYVTVQVFNPEGLGPNTTVLIMTDEGVIPSSEYPCEASSIIPWRDVTNCIIPNYRSDMFPVVSQKKMRNN